MNFMRWANMSRDGRSLSSMHVRGIASPECVSITGQGYAKRQSSFYQAELAEFLVEQVISSPGEV